ncbi:MAG: PEP-CTERM sorting domain-containing protein [Gemmatimonadaceae bacterium]
MRWTKTITIAAATLALAGSASAQGIYNSPTGNTLPGTVTPIGGIVADLVGLNGVRLVSQLSASSLYVGYSNNGTPVSYQGNPTTIGIQTGFTAAQLGLLGGGLLQAAFRITLFDGDSRAGDFDFNNDVFQVNGNNIQNFSAVSTTTTNSVGGAQGNVAFGFGDNILNTGFFYTNSAGILSNIFTSLGTTMQLKYTLNDLSNPTDNYYDFTQGVDGGLINIGTPPVVIPPSTTTPEPSSVALVAAGLLALAGAARRRTRRA